MISYRVLTHPRSIITTARIQLLQPQRSLTQLTKSVVPPNEFEDFKVANEPILGYDKGTKERRVLESALEKYSSETMEVPIVIGDKEYKTDNVRYQVMPHNHKKKLAKFYYATPDLLNLAMTTAVKAQKEWDRVPFNDKFKMWLKAADMMAGPWRPRLNATTMLGQGKTVIQAEIDAAAELIDFIRMNAFFAKEVLKYQPLSPSPEVYRNHLKLRGLEGFVAAVAPFNFTAIGGNLAYTPALMGNGVLLKPSDTAVLSNYVIFQIMKEVGVPSGVVNFVPSDGPVFGDAITASPDLAGINFTGSVPTFSRLWSQVGNNLSKYKNFPRLIGECGGKNFHFVHPSADVTSVVMATIRSAFEYSGQKCSACSRMYVPQSIWPKVKEGLVENMKKLKIGPVNDFSVFTSAVIDERAFDRISGYIDHAKKNLTILQGGEYDKSDGYFIKPTLIETKDPMDKIMREEIFGPVLAVYAYPDAEVEKSLHLVDTSTPYALTGAIFSLDEAFLTHAKEYLKYSTGNMYLNDRSTGSVVGQQPFGGGRMSGTNDKAGGPHNILKWSSPITIKETYVQTKEWTYSYMNS
ncbi:delta-1-pyrroline-5-carboxylate dehydrogenase, mitochondrial isoform X2 [Folsomia candida]|uniref:delta-1-pyrroline-5-carboxylate dehydrogenase, mitochondrial isoform X2 n=1 Tax=Folsomia candida TaxID=158441 RepID=UPI000B8F1CDA|nr:delta-1-pyrroline-5-carboxylate dehydrogenase, mitochondrial isoform X2 [Folsomia candida]